LLNIYGHPQGGVDIGRIDSLVKLLFSENGEKNPNQNYLYTIWLGINSIHTQILKPMNT
jgi:hypothetical protein